MSNLWRRTVVAVGLGVVALTGAAQLAVAQTPPPPPPPSGQGRGGRQGGAPRDTQQAPAVGTGSIGGMVVAEGTATPVRRARVNLSGTELRGGRSVTTNDQGQFSFSALPAGRFTLSVSKPGHVDITYGAKRPGRPGTPIQLADGQKVEKLSIGLPRGSVLTGIVVDENGEPSPQTQVRALRYVMRTGERTLQQAGQDTTDDRGLYRIFGLQPGEYMVSAVPRNNNLGDLRQTVMAEVEALIQQAQALGATTGGGAGAGLAGGRGGGGRGGLGIEFGALGGRGQNLLDRAAQLQQQLQQEEQEQSMAYAPVYFPGTTMASTAASVTLGIGEERSGVDFQLQLVATARVDGSVIGPDGTIPPGTQISLVPSDQVGMPQIPGVSLNMARSAQDGRFTFSNVTPGSYRVMARATIRDQTAEAGRARGAGPAGQAPGGGPGGGRGPGQIQQVLWASVDIAVAGQNLSGVVLNLQPGMTVSGRLSFEGGNLTPPTDLTRVRVTLAPRGQQGGFESGGVPPAQVDAQGRFTIPGVPPGRYAISAAAPTGGQGGLQTGTGTAPAGGRGGAAQSGGVPAASWVLKSAMTGGRDALDFPLVVEPNQDVTGATLTFVDRSQEVSGTIQDLQGQPTANFTIILYAADNRYWLPQSRRIVAMRPGTDGRFTFRNLPPGDYRLTAVTDVEPGEWFNPDFLQQLAGASIPVSLAEGERKVQDIKIAG
jgi:uncharacterized protein (DUF2141 family)